jgi:hypothetical protein
MFLGWYDADKKYPTARKLTDAVGRFQDKFGVAPLTCLVSIEDAGLLLQDPAVGRLKLSIVGAAYVPRHTFYVGDEDVVVDEVVSEPAPIAAAA